LLPALLLLTIGAMVGLADDAKDKAEKPKPASPADEFKALVQEHQKTQSDAIKGVRDAQTPEDREKAMEKYRKVTTDFAPRMLEFAKKHGKEPVAGEAYSWVLGSAGGPGAAAAEAAKHLSADFAQDEKIARGVERLARSQVLEAEQLVRAVIEKNKDAEIQGRASWTLAQMLKNRADQVERIKSMDADEMKSYVTAFGKEGVDQLSKLDVAKVLAEAETLFEMCATKHGDLKVFNSTMKEKAEGQLFELRHLTVGKEVPDIEGEDLDGKKFKLSDYRGKVVLLDFWGHW
jgi:hypothetical protein